MRHQTGVFKLIANSRGQTMAEYALILVTIALVATALVQNAGTISRRRFCAILAGEPRGPMLFALAVQHALALQSPRPNSSPRDILIRAEPRSPAILLMRI
jgi:Flp pilus assembly pilin Flp